MVVKHLITFTKGSLPVQGSTLGNHLDEKLKCISVSPYNVRADSKSLKGVRKANWLSRQDTRLWYGNHWSSQIDINI